MSWLAPTVPTNSCPGWVPRSRRRDLGCLPLRSFSALRAEKLPLGASSCASANSTMTNLAGCEKPKPARRRASGVADPARQSARSPMDLRGRIDAAPNFRCPECCSTECSDKASRHHRQACARLRSQPGAFAPRQHSSFRLPGMRRNPYLGRTARLPLSPRKCHAERKEDL